MAVTNARRPRKPRVVKKQQHCHQQTCRKISNELDHEQAAGHGITAVGTIENEPHRPVPVSLFPLRQGFLGHVLVRVHLGKHIQPRILQRQIQGIGDTG